MPGKTSFVENFGSWARNYLSPPSVLFGFDLRSIALFRVAVGVVTLSDVLRRSLDFLAHYTDDGVVPIAHAVAQFPHPWPVNLYVLSPSVEWQVFLVSITLLACLAVIFGIFTRAAWALTWILILSLQNRNELVGNAGDVVLRLLYFWGLFLPLDAANNQGRAPIFSMATVGLTFQIIFIYFFAAVLKSDPDWHQEGTAVFYALHLDKFATGVGVWLRQFPALLKWMTFVVWHFELVAPILLVSPYRFQQVRLVTTLALMAMHFGFALCLRIGTFPWICIAGLSILLPSHFWCLFLRDERRSGQASLPEIRFAPLSRLSNALAALFLLFVLIWNLAGLPGSKIVFPKSVQPLFKLAGLDQGWGMFAPRPSREDGWIVIPGETVQGRPVDVWYLDKSPVNWAKPKRLLAYNYRSERWIKYFENLFLAIHSEERPYFAAYLCHRWNHSFPRSERLKALEIFFMYDPTLPAGKGRPTPLSMIKFTCPL